MRVEEIELLQYTRRSLTSVVGYCSKVLLIHFDHKGTFVHLSYNARFDMFIRTIKISDFLLQYIHHDSLH